MTDDVFRKFHPIFAAVGDDNNDFIGHPIGPAGDDGDGGDVCLEDKDDAGSRNMNFTP